MFIDAHIHLSDERYTENLEETIENARTEGVTTLLAVSEDDASSRSTLSIARRCPDMVFPFVGIHPLHSHEATPGIEGISDIVAENREAIAGLGEIGLDPSYHKGSDEGWARQLEVFSAQLEIAEENELPINIHSRNAAETVLEILGSYRVPRAVFHWFDAEPNILEDILDRGFFVSFTPSITYSKRMRRLAEACPPRQVLSETDGPVRFWGEFEERETTPAFVVRVVEELSDLMDLTLEDMTSQIRANAQRLLGQN